MTSFRPELFEFLRDLARNNTRDWFQANKERYEREVREPLLTFISAFASPLRQINPAVRADPRPVGGSLFRIYRDVRFSHDKSPYKTHAAAQFRHKRGKDVHAPGFYLHLEPDRVFAGGGIWHPDARTLKSIRERIIDSPEKWRAAIGGAAFRSRCRLEGDTLKRAPKGFAADHPLIDDLKRKDFIAVSDFSEAEAVAEGFLERFVGFCRDAAPLTRFLAESLDLEW